MLILRQLRIAQHGIFIFHLIAYIDDVQQRLLISRINRQPSFGISSSFLQFIALPKVLDNRRNKLAIPYHIALPLLWGYQFQYPFINRQGIFVSSLLII